MVAIIGYMKLEAEMRETTGNPVGAAIKSLKKGFSGGP